MKIALIGNQNSGKTTLFNCLTGMNNKVGNWPGVTIEKKVGLIKGTNYELIDLPGIYSLSPYSIEERISRDFIIEEKPDVIINIIDATSIERSLYLTTQLLELDCKVIIALNMVDILENKGISINENGLERALGTKVIKISALKEIGIKDLIKEIGLLNKNVSDKLKIFDSDLENIITNTEHELNPDISNKRFIAIKLLENDKYLNKNNLINNYSNIDFEEIIATQRYQYIERILILNLKKNNNIRNITDKIDKILLNKYIAFPIFICIMFLVYYISVGVIGTYTTDPIEEFIYKAKINTGSLLKNIGISNCLNSLVVDGIITGIGAVLGFIPQLIILFLCISLLETTGYMSRIAFLLDNTFRKIGLSGKSIIPFIIGSGCSVPGITGTRIIENEEERELTILLTPFIPCSAKIPIIALFTGYFFPKNAGIVSASLYFIAILIIILSALIIKKVKYKNVSNTYMVELPEYKLPNMKYIINDISDKVMSFIKRAGTIILLCSIIIWFLVSFSFNMEYGINISESILATSGKKISWIFKPVIGVDSWEATISAIQGLIAKEQVVSSMNVISGLSSNNSDVNNIFYTNNVFGFFKPSSAYAFMIFNLFSAPCFGAMGAMKQELKSSKKLFNALLFQTCIAWLTSTIVYQVWNRIENRSINLINIIFIMLLVSIIFEIIKTIKKNNTKCIFCPYSKNCNKIKSPF